MEVVYIVLVKIQINILNKCVIYYKLLYHINPQNEIKADTNVKINIKPKLEAEAEAEALSDHPLEVILLDADPELEMHLMHPAHRIPCL